MLKFSFNNLFSKELNVYFAIPPLEYSRVAINVTSREMLSVLRNGKDNPINMLAEYKVWRELTDIYLKVDMFVYY